MGYIQWQEVLQAGTPLRLMATWPRRLSNWRRHARTFIVNNHTDVLLNILKFVSL
ncbi:hypothetical protein QBC31_22300 [Streptomyces sp. B21-079]|uniref:hypothetical protein n=1 Tax=Streptomyces sp. B21-079 TaxID=3039409 RepID=UPI002FF3ED91